MATAALQQVSSPYARENAKRTLEKPVALKFLQKHLNSDVFSRLEVTCKDGSVYIRGSKAERAHQTYKMLGRDALVLFRRGLNVYKFGIVIEKTENEVLADSLWGARSGWRDLVDCILLCSRRRQGGSSGENESVVGSKSQG